MSGRVILLESVGISIVVDSVDNVTTTSAESKNLIHFHHWVCRLNSVA